MFGFRRKKRPDRPLCAALVAAAGSSVRMGEDKLMLTLDGEPVLVHTLRALEQCPELSELVVVTREALVAPVARLCRDYGFSKVSKVIRGGETRTRSVLLGVREISCDPQLIAIHDGARPFVTPEVVSAAVSAAKKGGAAAPALPVKDTLKLAVDGLVERTVDRTALFAVQTPQVFDADLIRAALQKAEEDGAQITDDCSAVERLGMKVALTPGSEENIKLTQPGDLLLARGILEGRRGAL